MAVYPPRIDQAEIDYQYALEHFQYAKEQLRKAEAARLPKKERKAAALAQRNREIYAEFLAGNPIEDIAEWHKLQARTLRQICAHEAFAAEQRRIAEEAEAARLRKQAQEELLRRAQRRVLELSESIA